MQFSLFIKSAYGIITQKKRTVLFRINHFHQFTYNHIPVRNMNTKPPNILVYTGSNSPTRYNRIENNLVKCLKTENYIIYHLLSSEIKDFHPWMENCSLLIVLTDTIDNCIAEAFENYFKNHGNILVVSSKFSNPFLGNKCDNVLHEECLVPTSCVDVGENYLFRGKYSYYSDGVVLCWDKNNKPLIWKITDNKNTLILSEVYLVSDLQDSDCSTVYNEDKSILVLKHILNREFGLEVKNEDHTIPQISFGYFFSDIEQDMVEVMKNLQLDNISSQKSIFHQCDFKYFDQQIKSPIYFYNKDIFDPLDFDRDLYFSNLDSDVYGHSLVYFPVITTTMEAAKQLSCHEGIVVAADNQICGRGRGNNKWISPVGCAMFTLNFTISLSSRLGKYLTLLQHIAALAVVHGIMSKEVYKKLDLKIKWPNDIYHDKTKIGGLIVTSEMQKDSAHINIGWGINVSNSSPTSCINDVIDSCNSINSTSIPRLRSEEVIAFTISQMEFFIKDFVAFGSEKFFSYYYSYWMHHNKRVTLANLNQQGTVVGVDEFGFLKVETDDGKVLVFQPDGNRFDIMRNLIHSK